jgi:hypothetical protein
MDKELAKKIVEFDIATKGQVSVANIAKKFKPQSNYFDKEVCHILRANGRGRQKPAKNPSYDAWFINLEKEANIYWVGKDRPSDKIIALLMPRYKNAKIVSAIVSAWNTLGNDKNLVEFLKREY